jgi:hypothetical protein
MRHFNKLTRTNNRWFDDGYNKYDRKYYRFSGYDLGPDPIRYNIIYKVVNPIRSVFIIKHHN